MNKRPIGRCPHCKQLLYEPFADHTDHCPMSPYRRVITRAIPTAKEPDYDHETEEVQRTGMRQDKRKS